MKIRSLRTNHLENPIGYQMDKPLFTWTAEDSTGTKQQAARIEVALDETFGQTVFDSGLQAEISSLGFAPDMALAPRTRYFWRVTVVADNGDAATSAPAWFETGKMGEAWNAQWIAVKEDVHPILSRPFTLAQKPVRARIYATALGVYELNLNGSKVGDEILAPFYNDYNLWLQYQTYDVTDQLTAGENTLDAWLGNGWYKGRFGFIDKLDKVYGDRMELLLELRIDMPDGSEIVIGTDENWQARRSPVLESSIYDGEVYDARLENASDALTVEIAPAPKAPVVERLSPPVRKVSTVAAKELLHTPAGETVIDFGQLMTGWVEFDCDLPEGTKLFLEHGELLQNDCFYTENLDRKSVV